MWPARGSDQTNMTANQEAIDRINSARNAHQALGLYSDASEKDVERRYKELILQVHPDKNDGRQDATEAFKKLQVFYKEIIERKNNNHFGSEPENTADEEEDPEPEPGGQYEYRDGEWGWTRAEEDVFDGWERRQWHWRWTWRDLTDFFTWNFSAGLSEGDKTFMGIGFIILIIFTAIGVSVININRDPPLDAAPEVPLPPHPSQLHNQKIFHQECGAKDLCVIIFFPSSGLCADSFRYQQLDYFVHSLQRVASQLTLSHLGTLWTLFGDQDELESAIDTLRPRDKPVVLLASFTKDRFWTRSLQGDDDMRRVAPWILRCVKRKENCHQISLKTSNWTRWNTITASYFPNIQEKYLLQLILQNIFDKGLHILLSPFMKIYC